MSGQKHHPPKYCLALGCLIAVLVTGSTSTEARTIYALAERLEYQSQVPHPSAVAPLPDGRLVVVGSHAQAIGRDGTPRRFALAMPPVSAPTRLGGVAIATDGSVLITDTNFGRVLRGFPDGGASTVVAGGAAGASGFFDGYSGDGGPAAAARLSYPFGLAALPDGGFVIGDSGNHRVRRVSRDGRISTVAGNGTHGYGGDGGPALRAALHSPKGLAVTPNGDLLIADSFNHRIRKVTRAGTIMTVAGSGTRGFSGDGGAAVAAALSAPEAVAADRAGGFLIADTGNRRLRRVGPDGRIFTVAGTGSDDNGGPGEGYGTAQLGMNMLNGDGGEATRAALGAVRGVAVMADDSYIVAAGSHVRFLPSVANRRLAANFRAAIPRQRRIAYSLTRLAKVRLELRRGRRVRVVRGFGRAGRNRLQLPRRLRPTPYALRLTARSADGQVARDTLAVVFGRRLSRSLAGSAIHSRAWGGGVIAALDRPARTAENDGPEVARCHRLNRRCVDCRVISNTGDGCYNLTAVRLGADGQLRGRDYRCGRFKARPRWTGDSYVFALLG